MLSKWYIQQIVEWKILIVSKFDAEGKNLPNAKLRQNLGQNLKFLLYSNCLQHLSRINWELIIPLYAEFYDAELNSARILRAAELSPSGSVQGQLGRHASYGGIFYLHGCSMGIQNALFKEGWYLHRRGDVRKPIKANFPVSTYLVPTCLDSDWLTGPLLLTGEDVWPTRARNIAINGGPTSLYTYLNMMIWKHHVWGNKY
jgi:hypothetical protein